MRKLQFGLISLLLGVLAASGYVWINCTPVTKVSVGDDWDGWYGSPFKAIFCRSRGDTSEISVYSWVGLLGDICVLAGITGFVIFYVEYFIMRRPKSGVKGEEGQAVTGQRPAPPSDSKQG
jgi:hypothetical protein